MILPAEPRIDIPWDIEVTSGPLPRAGRVSFVGDPMVTADPRKGRQQFLPRAVRAVAGTALRWLDPRASNERDTVSYMLIDPGHQDFTQRDHAALRRAVSANPHLVLFLVRLERKAIERVFLRRRTTSPIGRHSELTIELLLRMGETTFAEADDMTLMARGDPVVLDLIGRKVGNGTAWAAVRAGMGPWQSGILGPDGRPLDPARSVPSAMVELLAGTNDQLLSDVRRQPDLMWSLEPRRFEELVATMLEKQGYSVQLTPFSRDGGFDVLAIMGGDLGPMALLVECKRYRPPHRVGVDVVRGLLGVVEQHDASVGVVVTSSYFTSGALEMQRSLPHRLHLHDYDQMRKWLARWSDGQPPS